MRHHYPEYGTRHGHYINGVEFGFIGRALAPLPAGAPVLDVSGGGGRLALQLAALGHRVAVTDISLPSLAHIASQPSQGRVELVLVAPGSRALPFRPGTIDAAICIQVWNLVQHDPSFFPSLFALLRPHARLVVDMTNARSYKSLLRRLIGRDETVLEEPGPSLAPAYRYSAREIIARAVDAGFALRALEGFNWPPFTMGSDSPWVALAAWAERCLMLRRLPHLSPWVLACFERRAMPAEAAQSDGASA